LRLSKPYRKGGENGKTEKRLGGKVWRTHYFCTLSLLPLKLSPSPTTQQKHALFFLVLLIVMCF
jgi:hypothetical protein